MSDQPITLVMPIGDGQYVFDIIPADTPADEVEQRRAALRSKTSLSDAEIARQLARDE